MAFWSLAKQEYLVREEQDQILAAIKKAEAATSGEIRVFIEARCPLVNTLDRADYIFHQLKMDNTINKNASLIYIAYKDREFAIYGDYGCITHFPKTFWKEESRRMSYHFYHERKVEGIVDAINALDVQYKKYFPSQGEKKNELPDEIVFGKK